MQTHITGVEAKQRRRGSLGAPETEEEREQERREEIERAQDVRIRSLTAAEKVMEEVEQMGGGAASPPAPAPRPSADTPPQVADYKAVRASSN